MGDDVAALIGHLNRKADVMGYSAGLLRPLQTAIRHPDASTGRAHGARMRQDDAYPEVVAASISWRPTLPCSRQRQGIAVRAAYPDVD